MEYELQWSIFPLTQSRRLPLLRIKLTLTGITGGNMRRTLRCLFMTIILAAMLTSAGRAVDPVWTDRGVGYCTGIARDTTGALYALGQIGVFKSVDDGETWQEILTENDFLSGFAVTVNPTTNDVFIAVEPGVYRSSDGGENWFKMTDSIVGVYAMAARADGLIIGAGSPGVVRSTNNGESWERVHNTLGPLHNGIAFSSTGAVFLVSLLDGLYRSDDDGDTWDVVSGDFGAANSVQDVVTDLTNGFVYATAFHMFFQEPTYNKVFRSDDDGETWIQIDSVGGIGLSMGIDSYGNVYSGRHPAVYSTDHGATWVDISSGIDPGDRLVEFVEASPGKMLLADMDDSLKVADLSPIPQFVLGDIAPAGAPDGDVTLADLSAMIDYLFIGLEVTWDPVERGNLDCSIDGDIGLADLTVLIDHLFLSLDDISCPGRIVTDLSSRDRKGMSEQDMGDSHRLR